MNLNDSISSLLDKLNNWANDLVLIFPNLAISIIVAVVAYFTSRYINTYLKKILKIQTNNKTIAKTFANIGTTIFLLATLFVILGILNLDKALSAILASAGILGLAVGLALQEPLTNLFSGVMLSIREKYNIGDLIETNDFLGIIKDINLKVTTLELNKGQVVSIPNKLVLQNPLINYTVAGMRRVDIECGVSYSDNLTKVEKVAIAAIKENIEYLDHKGIELYFKEFGESSINFSIRFWIEGVRQSDYLHAQSMGIRALKDAFDNNNISIPYPIRTIDFGIRGTEKLEEQFDAHMAQAFVAAKNN